jgi:ribonuclease E
MQLPQYSITRLKEDNVGKNKKPSYTLIQQPELDASRSLSDAAKLDEPAVKSFVAAADKKSSTGFIKRLWTNIFGDSAAVASNSTAEQKSTSTHNNQNRPHSSLKNNERRPYNSNQANRRRRTTNNNNTTNPQAPRQPNATQGNHPHPQRKKNPAHQASGNRVVPIKPDVVKKKEPTIQREPSDSDK